MIAIWTYTPVVNKYWLPTLRQLPSGSRPHPDITLMVGLGSMASRGAMHARQAIYGLRDLGITTIPQCGALKSDYGHSFNSWFDKKLWAHMAENLRRFAEFRADGDPRVVIDLEPYWDESDSQRYPVRGEPGVKKGIDEYRLAESLAPLVGVIKHEGITPWIAPGGMEYAAVWHLAVACPDAVLMDEATYTTPLNPKVWTVYEMRKGGIEALRRTYLPGFYGVALRDAAFQKELKRRDVGDYWVFLRNEEDEHFGFWEPGWASRGKR